MLNKILKMGDQKSPYFWDYLNTLRASILGANDGIISVSGIVLGVTGANLGSQALFISGVSGMLAGACSMAGGEWMSVSTQRDLQLKTIEEQKDLSHCQNCPVKLKSSDLLMPLHAACMSFTSFIFGSLIPLLAITFSLPRFRIMNTVVAMSLSLSLNAIISTYNTNISTLKTLFRNNITGFATILITFILGVIFST